MYLRGRHQRDVSFTITTIIIQSVNERAAQKPLGNEINLLWLKIQALSPFVFSLCQLLPAVIYA